MLRASESECRSTQKNWQRMPASEFPLWQELGTPFPHDDLDVEVFLPHLQLQQLHVLVRSLAVACGLGRWGSSLRPVPVEEKSYGFRAAGDLERLPTGPGIRR